MMRRVVVMGAAFAAGVLVVSAHAVTPPRDGGALPAYQRVVAKDPTAFTLGHAWVEKTQRAREARAAWLSQPAHQRSAFSAPASIAVTGVMRVPVLPGRYTGIAAVPVSAANLQNQIFDANATGTVTQYYSEVSYGQFTIEGDVYAWTNLTNAGTWYEGGSNGLTPGLAHTGQFIKEVLDARDGTINFAQYDNDGPDGLPNSGDDDGFVDALVVMHAEAGGECGGSNIVSHSWRYTAWPEANDIPYSTNDARLGGGFIKVDDYVIVPALNCGAVPGSEAVPADQWIDIGVLCHELGHTLGLPDLYDFNGGGFGIGHWGIMGTGNWNTPERPAHPEAWTRVELGWTVPTTVGWEPVDVVIPPAEQNAVAYKLPFTDERFRRSTTCAISGAYSLYCGLTQAEGTARGWASPGPTGGYGTNWYQTIAHDFTYSGSGAVSFQYKFAYDTEANYDYARVLIEVNGVETQLVAYTGTSTGTETINITPLLGPLTGSGGTYTLKFRVTSDLSFDDSDGQDPSACGALAVDDVNVTGGGVTYTSGFETRADGWFQDPLENSASEYWLVENRRKAGTDQSLHGEGLLIWHVDEEVLGAPLLVNSQGPNGAAIRGLVLEEADGQFDLNGGGANHGEPQDVYPGPLAKTDFQTGTTPASTDNTGRSTRIAVTDIIAFGANVSATLRAGDQGPLATSVLPDNIDNDQVAVVVEVSGNRLRAGATFHFEYAETQASQTGDAADLSNIVPVSLEWLDVTAVRGTVNVYEKASGLWNLVVTNPDGQTVTVNNALTLNHILATRLVSSSVDVIESGVRLRWELRDREEGEIVRLYRSREPNAGWVAIVDNLMPANGDAYEFIDADVQPGTTYYYLLESRLAGDVRELNRQSALIPARELVLEQNHPNPFNPTTTIRLYLPTRVDVSLEVFDVRGRLVRRLARGNYDAGAHVVEWDGRDERGAPAASGMYVYRLTAGKQTASRKMMLLK